MLLFWRKNRVKVKSIGILKENGKYNYLPISNLLETLNNISEKFPKLFKYSVKKYTDFVSSGYVEGVCLLIYYKDKKLFNNMVNKLIVDYCGKYEFIFNCGSIEWQIL